MKNQTRKSKITENWVDTYIEFNGHPPTYEEISSHFEIKNTASYNRCSSFRHKMKHHSKLDDRTKMDATIVANEKLRVWFDDNIGLDTTDKVDVFEFCKNKIQTLSNNIRKSA